MKVFDLYKEIERLRNENVRLREENAQLRNNYITIETVSELINATHEEISSIIKALNIKEVMK